MENTEQITKSNEFAKKHSITDTFLKWIVLFAMKNNLNQELMDNIFSIGSDADVISAQVIAAMIGMKDVSKIKSISDIKMVNSKSEESKRISELINCVLELSECNLALLEEFSSMKKTLIELKSIDVDKNTYNIGFKILAKQNEVLNDFKTELKDSIMNEIRSVAENVSSGKQERETEITSKPEERERKRFFFRGASREQPESPAMNTEIPKKENKQINESEEKKEAIQKYNETRKRIESNPVNDIFDVFEIIRTGAFDKSQCRIIKKGVNAGLTAIEILEYAKPENTSETMEQLFEFLDSVKIGQRSRKSVPKIEKDTEKKPAKNKKENPASEEPKEITEVNVSDIMATIAAEDEDDDEDMF
jgi:hypothetical protein